MKPIRCALVLALLATAPGCGQEAPPQMGHGSRRPQEAFLGPIDASFQNTASRADFPKALVHATQGAEPLLAALASAVTKESPRAALVEGSLPEVNTCRVVDQLSGGLLAHAALTTARQQVTPQALAGQSCAAILRALGSSAPQIAAALTTQLAKSSALELVGDDCTKSRELTTKSPRAAVSFGLTKATQGQELYLAKFDPAAASGLFEGGAHGNELALRSEFAVAVQVDDAWNTRRGLGHRAAVATHVQGDAKALESWRVEYLDLDTTAADGQKAHARVWLSSEVKLHYGPEPSFAEVTDWTYLAGGTEQHADKLTIDGRQSTADGTWTFDVTSSFPAKVETLAVSCKFAP